MENSVLPEGAFVECRMVYGYNLNSEYGCVISLCCLRLELLIPIGPSIFAQALMKDAFAGNRFNMLTVPVVLIKREAVCDDPHCWKDSSLVAGSFAAMFEGRMLRQEAHPAVQRNLKAAR